MTLVPAERAFSIRSAETKLVEGPPSTDSSTERRMPSKLAGSKFGDRIAKIALFRFVSAEGRLSSIVMSNGSISHSPDCPCGAVTSGVRLIRKFRRPEVSTNPPLPPSSPPRAESSPSTEVSSSANMMTSPPSPARIASARIWLSASTRASRARRSSPLPCRSPPT